MINIPQNTAKDVVVEKAIAFILKEFETKDVVKIEAKTNKLGCVMNRQQAVAICNLFREKGYHHEIRMHYGDHGTFFFSFSISKTLIRSKDYPCSWSEYVA